MIKIVTGYSNPGGSTVALKNLCKEFNARDIDCEMYGPNEWHLKFGDQHKLIKNLAINSEDKVIAHYINLPENIRDQTVFSCHEMWWFDFNNVSKFYKKVQFLTPKQANYHSGVTDYVLIPNVKEHIEVDRGSDARNVAGIIGAIEPRKNTTLSSQRAREAGCKKILLFGPIMDDRYYDQEVIPLMKDDTKYMGYASKSKIYSSIDTVFHSSNGEVASLVKDECATTGVKFFGNSSTDNMLSTMTNDEVISAWMRELS